MQGRDQFLNATNEEIEKFIAKENRYFYYQLIKNKRFWLLFATSPRVVLVFPIIALMIILSGYYYDWNWKQVIEKAFSFGIVSLLTGLIQHLITKK